MKARVEVKQKKLEIKDLRKRLGMTQSQFAEKLGVRVATVSEWENGHSIPDFLEKAIVLYDLLAEIHCTPKDLAQPIKKPSGGGI